MKMMKSKSWQWETTGTNKTAILFGVNIFTKDFRSTGKSVDFNHTKYDVFTVFVDGEEKTFAMTETSNGVYDFLTFRY